MESLESAAFTVLVPAGAVFDPADRGGLAALSCEMTLRGSGSRDSRQFVEDLENLGGGPHRVEAIGGPDWRAVRRLATQWRARREHRPGWMQSGPFAARGEPNPHRHCLRLGPLSPPRLFPGLRRGRRAQWRDELAA